MYQLNEKIVPKPYPYEAMPLEKRRQILPVHNVCSLWPADTAREDFVTGNGIQRLEMMGDPYDDKLIFNHEMLYEPKWAKTPEPPDLTGVMPEVRRLLREGQFEAAADLVEQEQIKAGFGDQMRHVATIECGDIVDPPRSLSIHPAYRLEIKQPKAEKTWDYLRWLDMYSGVVTTQWVTAEGAFSRQLFASFEDDVNVLVFKAPKGKLNVTVDFLPPVENAPGRFGGITMKDCAKQLSVAEDFIDLRWAYNPEFGQKGYAAGIKVCRKGGKCTVTGASLKIEAADALVLFGKIKKYEGGFTFEGCAPFIEQIRAYEGKADALIEGNKKILGEKMARSELRMGDPKDYALSAEELLVRTHTAFEFDPVLMDKLYDMGRFYQITDTGELPPMHGQHNINTNLQVCAGNNTGLFDEMDVYFRYYETKFDDFRRNAKLLFGARGLLCSIHCDYDSGLYYHFSKTYPHYCWTGCLGWIYNEFWNYYLATGDEKFLRERIVPALKEIALFFEDYACDRGPDGKVIFYPSFSPENPTPNRAVNGVYSTSINSVMDIMICREVLDNLIEACNTLGIEQENIAHWQAQKESLPRYLLDDEGGLKEWAWPTVNENYDHRHVSHHYDLWPGHMVTWEDEPELAKAIQISNRKRAHQNDSAHGIIHRCFSAIRLKDVPETVQNLYHLMNHGYVTRALQTCHNPYRHHMPDLQGAMPALLLEMCVYSEPGLVEQLPALLENFRHGGSIHGIWLYTWAKLEHLSWNDEGLTAEITSDRDQQLRLRIQTPVREILVDGEPVPVSGNEAALPFRKGETKQICVYF